MKREDLNYVLQHCDIEALKNLHQKIDQKTTITILQPPTSQTLLVPVKDPISEGEFYSGEALVTSCIVSIKDSKGWAMVLDDNKDLALYISSIDAVFESNLFEEEITGLYEKTLQKIKQENKALNQKVNSTKVSFDLM